MTETTTDTDVVDALVAAWNAATHTGDGWNGGDAVDLVGRLLADARPDEIADDDCTGGHVDYPHAWSPSGARCTRCPVAGTGDPCGDGDCTGHPDYPHHEIHDDHPDVCVRCGLLYPDGPCPADRQEITR
jgi:hypothetical protein